MGLHVVYRKLKDRRATIRSASKRAEIKHFQVIKRDEKQQVIVLPVQDLSEMVCVWT